MALLPDDARRAALSAGLLASDRDGEVVAAARALCGLLAKGGLDPRSVVAAGLAPVHHGPRLGVGPGAPARPWRERARMARYSPHINDWERAFLDNLICWKSLSARQEATLQAILVKSEGGAR